MKMQSMTALVSSLRNVKLQSIALSDCLLELRR